MGNSYRGRVFNHVLKQEKRQTMKGLITKRSINSLVISVFLLLLSGSLASSAPATEKQSIAEYRQWIEAMKTSPRGPFKRIRWFCNDGSVLPPKAYACTKRGGGHQHGEWSDHTKTLREQGYLIATLLAGADPKQLSAQTDFIELWNQLLIEKFLIAVDNGWIMRQALFYRGAIQEEDERAATRALLTELAGKPEWIGLR